MTQLKHTHPDADEFLKLGGFAVQRSENPFAQVASDMAIEQSINRATKMQCGIVGFSRHAVTVPRWILTAHDRAEITEVCMQHCGMDAASEARQALHQECQTTRMTKNEEDVLRVCSTTTNPVNPFTTDGEHAYPALMNLSSCVEASDSIAGDLLTAGTRGQQSFVSFVSDRLTCTPPVKLFQEPLKKLNLGTFIKCVN